MLTAKGYFKGSTFISDSGIAIPEGQPVVISLLEEERPLESNQYAECQKQKKVFQEFFMAWNEIDEPLTEAFDRSIAEGLHFRGYSN
jgi:hypothetical protein